MFQDCVDAIIKASGVEDEEEDEEGSEGEFEDEMEGVEEGEEGEAGEVGEDMAAQLRRAMGGETEEGAN